MKAMVKIVLLIIIVVIVIVLVWNLIAFFSLKRQANRYLKESAVVTSDEKVDLFSLLDSYGVPYSPDVEKNFLDILSTEYETENTLNSSLGLNNLYINKTWELNGIFENDISLEDFSKIQQYSIDLARHKYGEEVIKSLTYTCPDGLEKVTIRDYYSGLENPVVLYSCTANNLFYYFDFNMENLSVGKIWTMTLNFNNGMELLEQETKNNLDTLIELNEAAQIYVAGIYAPSDNFFVQRALNILTNRVNRRVEKVCEQYPDVHYVDVACLSFTVLNNDFHPNQDGQRILAEAYKQAIIQNEDRKTNDITIDEDSDSKISEMEFDHENGSKVSEHVVAEMLEAGEKNNRDYVFCSAAMENVLKNEDATNISLAQLEELRTNLSGAEQEDKVLEDALGIMIIERKIHQGYDVQAYSLNPKIRNEKLSLLDFQSLVE